MHTDPFLTDHCHSLAHEIQAHVVWEIHREEMTSESKTLIIKDKKKKKKNCLIATEQNIQIKYTASKYLLKFTPGLKTNLKTYT